MKLELKGHFFDLCHVDLSFVASNLSTTPQLNLPSPAGVGWFKAGVGWPLNRPCDILWRSVVRRIWIELPKGLGI